MSIRYVPGILLLSTCDVNSCLEVCDFRAVVSLLDGEPARALGVLLTVDGTKTQFNKEINTHAAAWGMLLKWQPRDGCFMSRRSHVKIFHARNKYITSRLRSVTGLRVSGTWKISNSVVGGFATRCSKNKNTKEEKGTPKTLGTYTCTWGLSAKHLFLSAGLRCRTLLSG